MLVDWYRLPGPGDKMTQSGQGHGVGGEDVGLRNQRHRQTLETGTGGDMVEMEKMGHKTNDVTLVFQKQ